MKIVCNLPVITDKLRLSQMLRSRWLCTDNTTFGLWEGCFDIFGNDWPVVYRIDDGVAPDTVHPGGPGTKVSELEPLLADVAPFLKEPLIVEVRQVVDKYIYVRARWRVEPGGPVKRVTWPQGGCRTVAWQPKYCMHFSDSMRKLRLTNILVHTQKHGAVYLKFSEAQLGKHFAFRMNREDALKLGLALVQASSGCVSPESLNDAVVGYQYLLGPEIVYVKEQSCPSSDSQNPRHGAADLCSVEQDLPPEPPVQPSSEALAQTP